MVLMRVINRKAPFNKKLRAIKNIFVYDPVKYSILGYFNCYLLSKVNQFVNKVINGISRVIYCLIFFILIQVIEGIKIDIKLEIKYLISSEINK